MNIVDVVDWDSEIHSQGFTFLKLAHGPLPGFFEYLSLASGNWSILIWVQGCAKLANVSSRTSFMPAMLAVHRAYYRDPSSPVSVRGRGWHKYQACPSYLLNWVWEVVGFAESENHRRPTPEEVRYHWGGRAWYGMIFFFEVVAAGVVIVVVFVLFI